MELCKVTVTRRSESGKGNARRLRASGQIPAVAYGKGEPALGIAVSPKSIVDMLAGELGRNTVIELNVDDGSKFPVLLADYQYHPVSRDLLHADFLKIALDAPVDVDVPFEIYGKCKGVVQGGVLHVVFRKLPVRCLPEKIPVKIRVDVTELNLDDHIAVSGVSLPEGVSVRLPQNQTLVAVVTESNKGEDEAPAAAAAPAAGDKAAAAPAAGDKAAAAPAAKAPSKGGKG